MRPQLFIAQSLNSGPFVPRSDEFLQTLVTKSPFRKTQAEALIAQIIQGKQTLALVGQFDSIVQKVKSFTAPGENSRVKDSYLKRLDQLADTDFRSYERNSTTS